MAQQRSSSSTDELYGAAAPWIDLGLRAWDYTLASSQAGPQVWQQWMDSVGTFMRVAARPTAASSTSPTTERPAAGSTKRPTRARAGAAKRRGTR